MQRNSVNKVLLVGYTGGDADVRYTSKGTAVANFSLATNQTRKNGKGEYEDSVEWHKVVLFGKLAEFCESTVKKGMLMFIDGHLQTRNWEDKEEQKHYVTEVIGERLTLLGARKNGSSNEETVEAVADGEDIPF